MSAAEPIATTADVSDGASIPTRRWERVWRPVERWLESLADHANPILVKETRQALKSRQFVVTFFLVLLACWVISVAGVAYVGPQIYYAAAGPFMLLCYYLVLAGPLALMVPFSAFRSIAAEQEENTYDLLSISTLTSKQIVTGKLWSAAAQMMVYLCAVSPCLAFTFLLRGVDALTTAFLLFVTVAGSLGLSMIALLLGAVARVKQTQIVLSVALVIGLCLALSGAYEMAKHLVDYGVPRDGGFWVNVLGLGIFYVTTFGLLRAAAAAQLAFPSENRSTTLRWWMMAQQACLIGWFAGAVMASGAQLTAAIRPMLLFVVAVATVYWYLMGAMLTGEWPHLSRRVQRSLPQSMLGRAFLSFFNPGPGSGLLFVVANLAAICGIGLTLALAADRGQSFGVPLGTLGYFCLLSVSYVTAFLGTGRLIINVLRRWTFVPMAAGFLINLILVLAGIGIPTVIQLTSRQFRSSGYSLIQMSNPMWTLFELADKGPSNVQADVLIYIIPSFAMAVLMLNMRSICTELMHHRIAPPIRVAEEESLLHPAPTPGPASPWEVEPT